MEELIIKVSPEKLKEIKGTNAAYSINETGKGKSLFHYDGKKYVCTYSSFDRSGNERHECHEIILLRDYKQNYKPKRHFEHNEDIKRGKIPGGFGGMKFTIKGIEYVFLNNNTLTFETNQEEQTELF